MDSYKTKLILLTIMILMVLDNTYAIKTDDESKYNIIAFILLLFLNLCNIH